MGAETICNRFGADLDDLRMLAELEAMIPGHGEEEIPPDVISPEDSFARIDKEVFGI